MQCFRGMEEKKTLAMMQRFLGTKPAFSLMQRVRGLEQTLAVMQRILGMKQTLALMHRRCLGMNRTPSMRPQQLVEVARNRQAREAIQFPCGLATQRHGKGRQTIHHRYLHWQTSLATPPELGQMKSGPPGSWPIEFVQECGYPGHCTNQNPASTGIKTPEAIFNATDSPNWAGEAQEFERNVKSPPGNRFILAISQESEKRCTSGTHGGTLEVFFVKQSHGMCI